MTGISFVPRSLLLQILMTWKFSPVHVCKGLFLEVEWLDHNGCSYCSKLQYCTVYRITSKLLIGSIDIPISTTWEFLFLIFIIAEHFQPLNFANMTTRKLWVKLLLSSSLIVSIFSIFQIILFPLLWKVFFMYFIYMILYYYIIFIYIYNLWYHIISMIHIYFMYFINCFYYAFNL